MDTAGVEGLMTSALSVYPVWTAETKPLHPAAQGVHLLPENMSQYRS